MNFVIPGDYKIKIKESEKIIRYLDFVRELKKLWNVSVRVNPIVIGIGRIFKN